MKKFKVGLLAKVIIAIILGCLASMFFPDWLTRLFETFNSIFSNYLGFAIPLIILGLVAPGIIELGGGAGKMLLLTTLIAYGSTVFSGYLSYFVSTLTYPYILNPEDFVEVNSQSAVKILPYFTIDMPALMSVTSSLVLAFITGLTLSGIKEKARTLVAAVSEFKEMVMIVITKSIIPLLPLFIFGIFLKLGAEGQVVSVLGLFLKVIVVIFVMHVALLIIQFSIAGAVTRRNPFKLLVTMLPAYMTALGTQSSAATIPVTLERAKKNGVKSELAEFVIPLCATIHLSGSILKIVACALAIAWMTGMPTDVTLYSGFIFMLGITMVAAPGVPGGAIMAALAVLSSVLGFDETQQGLMIALYIAMDSFGTACNVTGDGAIALVMDRIYSKK